MVKVEAIELLHEIFLTQFPDPAHTSHDSFPFKACNSWLLDFLKRHGFSLWKIGTRINKKGVTIGAISTIRNFHLQTRVLQLSERRDRKYGYTSAKNVYTHDQVQIVLWSSYVKTVDNKGVDEVYDTTSKGRDPKRFCLLNFFAPLERMPDGSNVPPPHIVFEATGFKNMDDWDQSEVDKYHLCAFVSFQEKAWVDAPTHMLGLKQCMGPHNIRLEESGEKGVLFEDSLLSHKTDKVLTFWREMLSICCEPQFIPANMTELTQVIDRHIGIWYKEFVYLCIRRELTKRLREAHDANSGVAGVTVPALTPREKRILITHTIGELHNRITKLDAYERANVATGALMPVSHCLGEGGP